MSSSNDWLDDIKANGRPAWIRFYLGTLSTPISEPKRFFRAVEQYGSFAVYEAVIITSTRSIQGDPLSYILAIAHSKWKEQMDHIKEEEEYSKNLIRKRELTVKANLDLAQKIKRALENNEHNSSK